MHSRDDVVIIGAGPIGLAHAIGIKRQQPNLKVVILEKYADYQRHHNLVLNTKNLKEFMRVTGTTDDADLEDLLAQIQLNGGSIRTSALENIFKKKAVELGVKIEIIKEGINQDNFEAKVLKRHPRLLIGADGTHSVTSNHIFGVENQIKHEFDYVLQLRYNVESGTAKALDFFSFYQDLIAHGMAGEERVGRDSVTLQIMVTKQEFEVLKKYTSKNAYYLYSKSVADEKNELLDQAIPKNILTFLNVYLEKKLKQKVGIDQNSVRISVNEAPATRANHIYKSYVADDGEQIPVLLVGDAALGLSYFKGLNAGLFSAAKFLSRLKDVLSENLLNQEKINADLQQFEQWFLEEWAPTKINEVRNFSTWQIRAPWQLTQRLQDVRDFSFRTHPVDGDINQLALTYMNEYKNQQVPPLYPHRPYPPIDFGEVEDVPINHSMKKIIKLFTDFFAPYKWKDQVKVDRQQPLKGIGNMFLGVIMMFVAGPLTLNPKRSLDGFFVSMRGAIEVLSAPLTWFVKPITRGIVTSYTGMPKVENNKGLQKLVEQGNQYVKGHTEVLWQPEEIYKARAICIDIHRKFVKGLNRGQESDIKEAEKEIYRLLGPTEKQDSYDFTLKINKYFSLFSPKRPDVVTKSHLDESSKLKLR